MVPTDEGGRADRTMIAYVDTFSMGDNVVHHVDTSWKPAWSGTNRIRHFVFEGDTLTMTTAPYKSYLDGRFGPVHTGLD